MASPESGSPTRPGELPGPVEAGFVYTAHPARVVFGSATIGRVAEEVAALGVERALVLSTRGQRAGAERVANLLGPRSAGVFAGAVMHTPVAVTEQALAAVRAAEADGVVAVGGGSTIGLGKAIALRTGLPVVAVPTTYAGSEMTTILGETADGRKMTQRTPKVLPRTVIYDVDLTLGLPAGLSATSGMNAIAHAVEALYAQDGNPVIAVLAEEGIRALAAALPAIVARPDDRAARADALYGAWLCATCLATTVMALHHKLCHVLGGSFGLPHAETHTIVLPHALAYNAPAAPEAARRIAASLGGGDPARELYDLAGRLGAPQALSAIGMPLDGIDRAASETVETPYWNPRPVEREAVRALIARAWAGLPPDAGA